SSVAHRYLHSFPTRRSSDLPSIVNSITMIAPDGIHLNMWYKLATSCPPFTYIFKQTIDRPGIFYRFIALLERLRLVDSGLARFRSEEHTSELQSRENLVCRL